MVAPGLFGLCRDRAEAVLTQPDPGAGRTSSYTAQAQQLQHGLAPA
jgi:hypothetical protein